MKSTEELSAVFRNHGFRVTPQRQCIFDVLAKVGGHPSADTVFTAAKVHMPTISLKAVYQILHDLEELGEIVALDFGTGQTRFDPNAGIPHHHVVCTSCGQAKDVYLKDGEGPQLPQASVEDYEITGARVIFQGLCAKCRLAKLPSRSE